MNHPPYIPGQRWVSGTEPEAGLGIIVDYSHRRVTVSFPAIGEQRVYAADNAPLNRVHYNPGDSIRSAAGESLKVRQVNEQDGRFIYSCVNGEGTPQTLDELDLDSFVQFSNPRDRLFAGQIDKLSSFALRRETLENLQHLQQSEALGLLGARVQLLPHQFYIANEVANRHAPRVLLADEVGLGKTIEAGLIIHQQLLAGRAGRVLILVPDSLVHQWLVEMLRRFNLLFTILDEQRCEGFDVADAASENAEANRERQNPFESAQLVICSLSFLVEFPERHRQAREAGWELMVVDEAHHLSWSQQRVSPQYRCVEQLAGEAQGLLLLTATPEQLGPEGHFARLKLLDPDRYYDLQKFREEEASYRQVNELVEKLMAEDIADQLRGSDYLHSELRGYLGEDATASLRQALQRDLDNQDIGQAIEDIIRSLLDRHGTGRVLFRNTRDAVAGFPQRRFNPHPLPTPEVYAKASAGASVEQLLRPEALLGDAWIAVDPRVSWLTGWLAGLGDGEKALVICASADTAKQLESHLNLRCGFRSAVFHEGMSLVQRDRAAAYFADQEDSAQVLVCSEIGSEGRNFQFARHLVLFDLPLNPDLLEQRVGRLDRIGQRHTVQIHLPHYDSGATLALMRWYHEGIRAFERVCPVASAVYGQIGGELRNRLPDVRDPAQIDSIVAETRILTETALLEFQQGRDRLLELSSCNPARAEQVISAVSAAESPLRLAEYMEKVFDQFGVDHSYHSADAVVLKPGDQMHGEGFPGLPEEGMTATFSRGKALAREDLHFLSWEHPMVSGAMELILGGDFGNTAVCTMKLPPLKAGTLLLENIFTLHCPAPKHLQLYRFLPAIGRRIVLDAKGDDLTHLISSQHFDKLGRQVARGTAQDLVRHARPQIAEMIKRALELAAVNHRNEEAVIDRAIAEMERYQQAERDRLVALAQVNPNIRREEIDYIEQTTDALRRYIAKAEWRLDALRVAVTV